MKKRKPRFKLAYLREIHRNLMLHATQPLEREFNLYVAPPVVLRRAILTLEDLRKRFKEALGMQLRAAKKGEWGSIWHDLAMVKEMGRSLEGRRSKRRRA